MKLTDLIISGIIKKGVLYEARNCDMEFDIPYPVTDDNGENQQSRMIVKFKAEHMKVSIEKE